MSLRDPSSLDGSLGYQFASATHCTTKRRRIMKTHPFDIGSPDYQRNPYPTLARMIEQGPVVKFRLPLIGPMWAVTTYDAVNDLLRDHATFVRDPRTAGLKKGANLPWWFPSSMRTMTETMITRDEPDHRRLRGLVEQAFVRRSVDELRPRFRAIATEMLNDLEANHRRTGAPVDLVAGLARPFPLAVICELLGLPPADRPMFVKQAEAITRGFSLLTFFRLFAGLQRLSGYVRERIQAARSQPQAGLISALIVAEQEGHRLTEQEMVTMILLLLFAGHVTTVHLIGGGVYTLLEQPEQKQRLLSEWSLVNGAVNEMLRYLSPVQMTKPLLPVRDLDWRGHSFQQGDKVIACLASANVDPARFDEPTRFDIGREPNPHVAFGAGIHNCLGWKLAVAEAEIAVQELFTRFPNLNLSIPQSQVRWSRQPGTRGMESLPVRLW
jgi:cytochrome P450